MVNKCGYITQEVELSSSWVSDQGYYFLLYSEVNTGRINIQLNIYILKILVMTEFVKKVYMRNWDLNCVEEENTFKHRRAWLIWDNWENQLKMSKDRDFPGGSVIKNLSASAGDMGSIPDLGGSLCRATSLCAITIEPVLQSPCATTTQAHSLHSPCSTTREATHWEAHTLQLESSPCWPQLEKAHEAAMTQYRQ